MTHLLANLGWVDFDLGCSIILPSYSATSSKFPSAQAEFGGTVKIQVNSTQVRQDMGHPVFAAFENHVDDVAAADFIVEYGY